MDAIIRAYFGEKLLSATIEAGFLHHSSEKSTSRQVFVCSTGNQIGFMWRGFASSLAHSRLSFSFAEDDDDDFSFSCVDLEFGNGIYYYFGR